MGLFIFAIGFLIHLYTKKEEEENYIEFKLIGFYLLGAFTFNFDFRSFPIIIPVGFIIFLLFMKNKERLNCEIKKKASVLGFIILCIGILNSIIYNAVEYRDREIHIKNISIKSLRDDYETIKKELGIEDVASIESFDLDYNDNEIKNLYYTVKDYNNKTYYIEINNNSYSINVNKTYDDIFMFDVMSYNMDIETLLDVVSNMKFKKYEKASYYTVKYRNEENYYEDDINLYTVDFDDYSTEKLNSKYPIYDVIDISHTPMKQISEGSWESITTDTYLLRYNVDENLDE